MNLKLLMLHVHRIKVHGTTIETQTCFGSTSPQSLPVGVDGLVS